MVNGTCQMICYVAQLASYHGHTPDYWGNFTISTYSAVALTGTAVAATIYVAQRVLSHTTPMQSKAASIAKWTAGTLAFGSAVVALMDQFSMFSPTIPPSDYFPLSKLGYGMTDCAFQCSGGTT